MNKIKAFFWYIFSAFNPFAKWKTIKNNNNKNNNEVEKKHVNIKSIEDISMTLLEESYNNKSVEQTLAHVRPAFLS